MEAMPGAALASTPPVGPSFIKRHLRGDYSLGRSYWLHSVCLGAVVPNLLVLAIAPLTAGRSARYGAAAVLLITGLGLVTWCWSALGAWVSSGRHVQRGGKRFWAIAAKVMLTIGLVSTTVNLIKMRHAYVDYARIALGKQLGPATTFQLRADGRSLLLEGGINDDTADRLVRTLDAAPDVRTVVLSSTGGWVTQGRAIADIIAARGLNTYVEQHCASACTIAFLGGKDRAADPAAKIGFHIFHSVAAIDDNVNRAANEKLVRDTYSAAGLPEAFISKIVATGKQDIWYPDQSDMLHAGVLTRISKGGETAALATTATSREKVADEFRKSETFRVLEDKYPAEFNRVIDGAWKQVQEKAIDHEIILSARAMLSQITTRLLPSGSDQSLTDFVQLLRDRAQALQPRNSAACAAVVFPDMPVHGESALPSGFVARESVFTIGLIRDSDATFRKTFDHEEIQARMAGLLASLTPAQVRLMASAQQRAAAPGAACAAVIAYLSTLANLPDDERHRTLRMLYSRSG